MKWTPEKLDELRALANSGKTQQQAADEMGLTFGALRRAAQTHDIRFHGTRAAPILVWTPEVIAKVREHAANGLTKRETAEAMGMSFGSVKGIVSRFRIPFPGHAKRLAEGNDYRKKQKREPLQLTAEEIGNEADAIARFIAERGVTKCKPAYAAPSVQGALDEREAAKRIKRLPRIDTSIRPGEARHAWFKRMAVTGASA